MAGGRGFTAVGNGEILIEASEVIDANHVVQFKAVPQAGDPPLIARFPVLFPAVERIAPELASGRKTIRRNTCHSGGNVVLIQLEHLRIRPCIGGIQCHIDGDITDDADALFVGVSL